MRKIVVIVGTRPEAIKLAPVIQAIDRTDDLEAIVCNSGQHEHLCGSTLSYFAVTPHVELKIMRADQSLGSLMSALMRELERVLTENVPDAVLVQGDTMSAFCGALAAFYRRLPIFHVEAGLRSHDLREPFPEEGLRQMLSRIAALHFAPTQNARKALLAEGIKDESIAVTGNTVIDALNCLAGEVVEAAETRLKRMLDFEKDLVLVTAHRRENHGERLQNIIEALRSLASQFPNAQFVLPVHPNPNVHGAFHSGLGDISNVHLLQPLAYPELVALMRNAALILTDSGGIQEEAPTFGAPVLVMRFETERVEGIAAGCAKLVGADADVIVREASRILNSGQSRKPIANPYGDGLAAARIAQRISKYFEENRPR